MSGIDIQARYEILKGEQLKSAAELALHVGGPHQLGQKALELYAFGAQGRIVDEALKTDIAGIEFENPVSVGAGWDKKGKAMLGLHALGFAGIEVGTVPLFGQYGNEQPRLWTINKAHSVGLNRLGFNSDGAERVSTNLGEHATIPFPIGINIGLNKLMPAEHADWAHAAVIKHVYKHASYIALGISSPNTSQVRGLQRKEPLKRIIIATQQAMIDQGGLLPFFIKIDGDQTEAQLHDVIEVALETNTSGIIAINSTVDKTIKAKYGSRWAHEAGGLTGADADYRRKAITTIRRIREEAGDKLTIIGAGGVDSAETALEKIKAGASGVQVVTAIRPSGGKVAARINAGLLEQIERDNVRSIKEYIGIDTSWGVRAV